MAIKKVKNEGLTLGQIMRTVVQRVKSAQVRVGGETAGSIGPGLLILLGIGRDDTDKDADYLIHKLAGLRIFPDENGKMNRSVRDVGGSMLIVSQFTLYGDTSKGMRPAWDAAAPPDKARTLYEYFVGHVRGTGIPVQTGVFQATMEVSLINDGPVTLVCESKR